MKFLTRKNYINESFNSDDIHAFFYHFSISLRFQIAFMIVIKMICIFTNLKCFRRKKSFDDVILLQTPWFLKLHHQKKKSRKDFEFGPLHPKEFIVIILENKKLDCKSEKICRMQSCVIKLLDSVAFKLHLRCMFFVNDIERDSKIICVY